MTLSPAQQWRQHKKEQGLCTSCGCRPSVKGQVYCPKCKEHRRQYSKHYYKKNKKKVQAVNKKWWQSHKEVYRGYNIQARYGISEAEYDQLYREQGGVCKLCQQVPKGRSTRLVLDHAHGTGRLRGFLCIECNLALGYMKDNPELLRKAAVYIEESAKDNVVPLRPAQESGATPFRV